MQNPQALPRRITELSTQNADELSAAQPERGREYVQLASGALDAAIRERADGVLAALYERWGCALRVRCARPRSYVAFTAVLSNTATSWCGLTLRAGSVLEVDRDWELTTHGAFESISFAVDRATLERSETQLAGGAATVTARGNRALDSLADGAVAARLRRKVAAALSLPAISPEARRALEGDLIHLAVRLRGFGARSAPRLESLTRRRLAVRKVEEYLEANERTIPSLAELCAVAGTSERTLEYAFREQVGTPPARYLRLRRLSAVRRELLRREPSPSRVTDVAMRWGFWELGRFARDYRTLFAESPSATLAGTPRQRASEALR
jgi:AraC family ethanolamine operon transcriptional activator